MERWITQDEIMHRIKTHPDLTEDDKENFYFDLQMLDLQILYLTDKGKEKINKPIIKNQQRNKMKLCPIHNETLNEDGLCNTCLEQSNK